MRKLSFLFLFIFITSIYGQSSSLGIYAGYGMSAFSDDFFFDLVENEQAGYIPIGAQITIGKGTFQFGAEASYSIVPFTWEVEESGEKVGEIKVTQLFAGAFARANIKMKNEKLLPYVKAGGGAYMGKIIAEPVDGEEVDHDFKTAFGFYGALGIDFKLNPTSAIFVEIPFHVVSREPDIEGVEFDAEGANNYAVLVGFRYLFR